MALCRACPCKPVHVPCSVEVIALPWSLSTQSHGDTVRLEVRELGDIGGGSPRPCRSLSPGLLGGRRWPAGLRACWAPLSGGCPAGPPWPCPQQPAAHMQSEPGPASVTNWPASPQPAARRQSRPGSASGRQLASFVPACKTHKAKDCVAGQSKSQPLLLQPVAHRQSDPGEGIMQTMAFFATACSTHEGTALAQHKEVAFSITACNAYERRHCLTVRQSTGLLRHSLQHTSGLSLVVNRPGSAKLVRWHEVLFCIPCAHCRQANTQPMSQSTPAEIP